MFAPDIFVVVLTGGIASGKTAVSDRFAQRGVPVIDTDVIAHEVVKPGSPALEAIAARFGRDFLNEEGTLNRARMRDTIFSDPEAKSALEAILHPAIAQRARQQVLNAEGPWCLLVVPLLVESANYGWVDRILVVDVDEEVQVERVMARDNASREQALSILGAQATRRQRLAIADDIIDSSGTLEDLDRQVARLFQTYNTLSAEKAK